MGAFPVTRDRYTKALEFLARAKPKAVILKFFFDQPRDPAVDRDFARAMALSPTFLLSIPGMRESIRAGMAEPLDEAEKDPGW